MGGAYGNVPALRACISHALERECGHLAFLGDATGCCGHSDETLSLIRHYFDSWIAGNHEQEAARGSLSCGCGYEDREDEQYSCLAHAYALESLSPEWRHHLTGWPDRLWLETEAGRILLCHGSPARTNEFLYESGLDDSRLVAWLEGAQAVAMVCTHTGIPWLRALPEGRLALNCGAVGKPDHDGDPAVHYAIVHVTEQGLRATIERVVYDASAWADRLQTEGVDAVFTAPLRTGWWTIGARSLPAPERHRAAAGREPQARTSSGPSNDSRQQPRSMAEASPSAPGAKR